MAAEPHQPRNLLSRWAQPVLGYIDKHASDVVATLSDLVRIPSVSGSDDENSVQALLADAIAGDGLEVDHWQIPLPETLAADGFPGVEVGRSEAWGLVGRARGSGGGRSLMLNCHVDVVPPGDLAAWQGRTPFSGAVSGGLVYGRGACDMKGGLIAARWAVRALVELRVPLTGDVLLACVQGEEDGGLGTFALLGRGWRADACVIPEPTSLDLVPACAGALTFRLRIPGLAAHASRRRSGISAVEKFWPVFWALRDLEARRNDAVHPLMSRWDIAYPIEVGRVQAGDWSSSVPDLLVADGRLGVALDEPPGHARAALEGAVAAACSSDPWLRDHPVSVEWWGGQFAPGLTGQDAPVFAALRDAHSAVSGHRQRVWGAPYGSDLRLMTGLGGVPTVHYGPGDARLAHGPREHVAIGDVLTAARALAVLILQYCSDDDEQQEAAC
ncbi:MAG: ArgE/DapE family deacylase [Streptosporangiaceae bacterium]